MLAQPPQRMRGWSTKSRLEMMAAALRCILTTGDISNLKALASLQKLSNYCNQVTGGFCCLSALTSLQKLLLPTILTGDIGSLSALTGLLMTIIHCSQVTGDISSLSGLASRQASTAEARVGAAGTVRR